MTHIAQFQGFFSYAHHDAAADPNVIEALVKDLELRVDAKLVNAKFKIWIDKSKLKTGQKWFDKIRMAVEASHVLILIVSPKWLTSEHCRKEYAIFSDLEAKLEFGEYVVPLVIRSCEGQKSHFTDDQLKIFKEISERQYQQIFAEDFAALPKSKRNKLIDAIADDVVGMIERRRSKKSIDVEVVGLKPLPSLRNRFVFDSKAHNLEKVSFLTDAEVYIGAISKENRCDVFAFVDFLERLYVQTTSARIEFGIRRAILQIEDKGDNDLSRVEDFSSYTNNKRGNAYYISHISYPNAITVCIDPTPGSYTLRELPLPPAPGENRLAKLATVSEDVQIGQISARLNVSLCPEGLFFFAGESSDKPSPATAKKIAAIVNTMISKKIISETGKFEREVPVKRRKS